MDNNPYIQVKIKNPPHHINHIGSLTYHASLITAVGREIIHKIIECALLE